MTTLRFTRTLAALAVALPSLCSAAVVNIHQTVDLSTLNLSTGMLFEEFNVPATLAVGDTLHLTYDFVGEQTLRMFRPMHIFGWLGAQDTACTEFQATGSLQFVNGRGPVQSVTKTESSECLQFGLSFEAAEFASGHGMIEFSGLDFFMTVDAYNNRHSRDYAGPLLYLRAGRLEIGSENVIDLPEPAGLGLIGIGMAALVTRRRKAAK